MGIIRYQMSLFSAVISTEMLDLLTYCPELAFMRALSPRHGAMFSLNLEEFHS